jgi:hypothetical protein
MMVHASASWYLLGMKPLQVLVPEDELERLEKWSRRRGWSKSQTIRFAIRALTGDKGIMSASGMIEGLPPDLSENVDSYLAEAHAAPRRPRGRAKRLRR